MKAKCFHIRSVSILAILLVLSLCIGCESPTTSDLLEKKRESYRDGPFGLPEPEYRDNITITYTRDTSRINNKSSDPSKPIDGRIYAYDPKAPSTYLGRIRDVNYILYEISPNIFQGTVNNILIQTDYYTQKHRLLLSDYTIGNVSTVDGVKIEGAYDIEYSNGHWVNGIESKALLFKMSKE